jgi:hypothetical protein
MDRAELRRPLLLRARELSGRESGLAVVVTLRSDGSFPATVVNAGVLEHPLTGELVVGFVARGRARKLANLRARPQITVLFRSGWEWVAVEGIADLAGPDDPLAGLQHGDVTALVRALYAAAVGGTVDDWAELDAMFAEERHTAVLVHPSRVYSNSEAS